MIVSGDQLNLAGVNSKDLNLLGAKITQGKAFSADDKNELILGKLASDKLKKKAGDTVTLNGNKYTITGIFETGNVNLDSIGALPLKKLQKMDEEEGKVYMIYVKIKSGQDLKTISKSVEKAYPGELTSLASLEDYQKADNSLKNIETATMAISLLAIIVGGIGIINTMIMSVFERTREIGVLKSVGWKSRRILGMILGESIVLTLIAGMVLSLIHI